MQLSKMAMASRLRTPAGLIMTMIVALLIISIELGGSFSGVVEVFQGFRHEFNASKKLPNIDKANYESIKETFEEVNVPCFGVASLLNVDMILFFTVLMMTLPLVIPPQRVANMQGIASLIVGLFVTSFSVMLIVKVLVMLWLMIALLMSIPFGTLIYIVKFGHFDVGYAAIVMSALMTLKIILAAAIVIAHERFLQNKGLVLIIATSLGVMILINVLHNFPPVFLVSITDAIAAIVVSVIAILWAIPFIISGVFGIKRLITHAHRAV